jgi:hypothetical protein
VEIVRESTKEVVMPQEMILMYFTKSTKNTHRFDASEADKESGVLTDCVYLQKESLGQEPPKQIKVRVSWGEAD